MIGQRGPTAIFTVILGAVGLLAVLMLRLSWDGADRTAAVQIDRAEAEDDLDPAMVREWRFTPDALVPATTPTLDDFGPDFVVKVAIDLWPGWAPLVLANDGFEPRKVWKMQGPRRREFRVHLVLAHSPAEMREWLAAGTVDIAAASVDALPSMLDELGKDPRTMPRVFQQVDWSSGGDAIVARGEVATVTDLVGRKVVVADGSPSRFFLLKALGDAGIQPGQVDIELAPSELEALAAFNRDRSIAACAARAPFIYGLEAVEGNKLVATTKGSNRLIADVLFARADFAAKFPGILEELAMGIFEAMSALRHAATRDQVAGWMAVREHIFASSLLRAFDDLQWTNYADNRAFLFDSNHPASFERIYDTASILVRAPNEEEVPFERICDLSILKRLGRFESSTAEKSPRASEERRWSLVRIQPAEGGEILARRFVLHFAPNSHDPYHRGKRGLYDPAVDGVLGEVGRLAGEYGAGARIIIEGHADSSYRGWVDEALEIGLASARAGAVKEALTHKFPSLPPESLVIQEAGASRPASLGDPSNHARNRRVEVTIYPSERKGFREPEASRGNG